jgi:hypothetical protein
MTVWNSRPVAAGILAASVLLSGCAGRHAAPDGAELAGEPVPQAWLAEAAKVVPLDRERSQILVRVYRAGRLARLGHNHAIEVADLTGELLSLAAGGGLARLRFRPERLRVDDPAVRARAGDAFAQLPDDAAIEGTRRNMLGPQVLDTEAWPEIGVLARIDDLNAARAEAEIHLSLRGVGRLYRVPVLVQTLPGEVSVSGSLQIRQSDYGIAPFSVMGGALQVRDMLDVDFRIVGRLSGGAL